MDRERSQYFVVTVQAFDSSPLKWDNDPLMSLPVELTERCLELLDFRSRIRASHVSRAWRNVALSNRAMWALGVFSHATQSISAEILAVMLARSGPLPFSFVWDEFNVELPVDLFAAVLRNMSRMAHITVPGMNGSSCRMLLAQNAPLMRSFVCDATGPGHLILPSHWAGDGAPHLRVLHLGNFVVPYGTPRFHSLRSFRGHVPSWAEGRIDNISGSLYNLLPNVTSLDLLGVTQTTLSYLLNPPPGLEELRLQSDRTTIDYTALLESCTGCSLRVLDLNSAKYVLCAVRLFTSTIAGSWTLEASGADLHVALQSDADESETRYEVQCSAPLSFVREPALLGELSRVAELSFSMSMLVELYSVKPPSFTLPSLRSLTASLSRSANVAGRLQDMAERRHPRARVPIRAPQLLWVTVAVEDEPYAFRQTRPLEHTAEWLADDLPRVLKTLLDVPYYENLTVSMLDATALARRDLSALRRIAGRLQVEDRSRGEIVQFAHEAGSGLFLRPDCGFSALDI